MLPANITPTAAQTVTDGQVVAMWLHGRAASTKRAYLSDTERFSSFVGVSLAEITLADIQAYSDSLEGLSDATRARLLASVKSLMSFALKIGYIRFNPAAAVRSPKTKDTLAERILPESKIVRIIALSTGRNHALLSLLYQTGMRVSEICGLKWRDIRETTDGAIVTVYGKGSKTRHITIPRDSLALLGSGEGDAPVFRSRKGGHLATVQVHRIIKTAAREAGIREGVSPHWFRHCAASHALDNGCPLHVVQQTLGHSTLAITGKYLHIKPGQSMSQFIHV